MTSVDQQPPASTPPKSFPSSPVQPPAASGARTVILTVIVTVGGLLALVSGALVVLADWLVGWHLTRPWLQVSATFGGVLLLLGAALVPTLPRARRLLMSVGGLLFLLAVADSLNGTQDFLPLVTMLLLTWAFSYADTTAQLLQAKRPATLRRQVAVGLGILATTAYLGTATYYFSINLTSAPVIIDHHPLFAFGIVMLMVLGWVGDIPPYGGPLTGAIRICATCGLRNIKERQTCKRCGTRLGLIEHVP
jgi:hypothetical protein